MSTSFWTCVLLSCIIVGVNTFIVIEINIVYIIRIFDFTISTLIIIV